MSFVIIVIWGGHQNVLYRHTIIVVVVFDGFIRRIYLFITLFLCTLLSTTARWRKRALPDSFPVSKRRARSMESGSRR